MSIFDKLFKKSKTDKEIKFLYDNEQPKIAVYNNETINDILDDWDFKNIDMNYSSLNNKELLRKIEQKDLENFDLKMEVSYYERYLKFLEDNFIFISKSTKNIKEIFDKIGEADE